MNKYEEGYVLAKNDIARHGFAMAIDKMHLFEDDMAAGYADAVHGLNMNSDLTTTKTV